MVAGLPYTCTQVTGTTSVESKTCPYSFTTWYPLFPGCVSSLFRFCHGFCLMATQHVSMSATLCGLNYRYSIFVPAFVNSLKPDHKKVMLNNKPRIMERARIEAAILEDVDHRMVAAIQVSASTGISFVSPLTYGWFKCKCMCALCSVCS